MLLFLREHPGSDDQHAKAHAVQRSERKSFKENVILTVSNRSLWLLALSLGMLNACRYGFLDWGVSHLVDIEQDKLASGAADIASVLKAAVKFAVLPIGGIAGSFFAGWATDRFFGSRRAPVIVILLLCLGCLTLVYDSVAHSSFIGTIVLLLCVGFTVYGPQVLLVGTAPADLAVGGTAAAAAGFVNFIGYIGAAILGDLLTGYLVDNHGWEVAIYAWAGWAFGAAILVAVLWNAGGRRPGQPPDESAQPTK
jgi:sugar phosphate permease